MVKKLLKYWLPPVALMIIIFALSSRSRIAVSDSYATNFAFFKTLHVLEYAALFFLLFRAFYGTVKIHINKMFFFAIIITILYAMTDEFHQTFTPTRQGALRDVFIDSVGILLMFSYTKLNLAKLKRFL